MSTVDTQRSSSTTLQVGKIDWRRLWFVGLFTIIVSVVVNIVIDFVAVSFLTISPAFDNLQAPGIISLTVAGAIGAVFVFALVCRFSTRPIWLYRIIATIVLVVTFIPDLALFSESVATVSEVISLMVMHLATYIICVCMLTTMTRVK